VIGRSAEDGILQLEPLEEHVKKVSSTMRAHKVLSRQHCKIYAQPDDSEGRVPLTVYVMDLKSSNGTYVNDVQVPPNTPTKLKLGAVVCFGKSSFKLSYRLILSNDQ
jgi:pSer/pThr/pTyr-binding forkhead associated (FHA) protein